MLAESSGRKDKNATTSLQLELITCAKEKARGSRHYYAGPLACLGSPEEPQRRGDNV
jgi:hypothetical protein